MNTVIATSALVLTVVVLAQAYNFEDSVFNRYLADDLDELTEEPFSHPRHRRDEEAVDKCRKRWKPALCCAEETFEKRRDDDKKIRRECFKEVRSQHALTDVGVEHDPFNCDRMKRHRRDMTCVVQCVGQKKDMLDEKGNPKDEEIKAFIEKLTTSEPWFEAIHEKVASMCLDEARNATANRDDASTAASDGESCNPAGIKLEHCLLREIQRGCPDDQIKDQKACAWVRDKIGKHNDFFPPPPSPPAFMNDE